MWTTKEINNEQHLYPLIDDIAHELTMTCICGPAVEYRHKYIQPFVRHEALNKHQRMEMK